MVFKVLCISDSRGRGLEDYFHNYLAASNPSSSITANFLLIPGGTIEAVASQTFQNCDEQNYDLIIINAGICNFTAKSHFKGFKCINYSDRTGKIEQVARTIEELDTAFGHRVNICTIPPASLNKSFTHKYPNVPVPQEFESQQESLLHDIGEINRQLIQRNFYNGASSIDLAKQVFSSSLKRKRGGLRKVKFNDKNLPDGVHPSENLRNTWFKLISNFIITTYQSTAEEIARNTSDDTESDTALHPQLDTSTEESEVDSGNFKRAKKQR